MVAQVRAANAGLREVIAGQAVQIEAQAAALEAQAARIAKLERRLSSDSSTSRPGTARTPGSRTGSAAKNTGLNRLPWRQYAINAAWVELALTAADLIAWTQTTLLDGDLAVAEPATLRYRLLHVAARITRG